MANRFRILHSNILCIHKFRSSCLEKEYKNCCPENFESFQKDICDAVRMSLKLQKRDLQYY